MRPLLVGEDNPYSADPRHALFPYPERSAGHRLATVILGLTRAEYLRRFDRVNLCAQGKWSGREARASACHIVSSRPGGVFVLLGRKVAEAFAEHAGQAAPFDVVRDTRVTYYFLPHPSGRSRVWNEPGAVERARALLAPLLLPVATPGLAPCKQCGKSTHVVTLAAHRGCCSPDCRDYDPDPGPHNGDFYGEPPH